MTARLLTIMGSGETSPTMVATHREIFEALGRSPSPAVMLDTPFGFQENANEIVARTTRYFATSLGQHVACASLRSAAEAGALAMARMEASLQEARWVFSGPGSPSYALDQWNATDVSSILVDKLRNGGAVTFASAAAVTLGRFSLPVYEIYKVGRSPHWIAGLDVLGPFDIAAAVIPHFDNAEGGTHDTRFCYMGARRLALLEQMLPPDTSIIGIDEHTACIIDFSADEVRVQGKGRLTVIRNGSMVHLDAGNAAPLDVLRGNAGGTDRATTGRVDEEAPPELRLDPLDMSIHHIESAFAAAISAGDADEATRLVLQVDDELEAWSADLASTDSPDLARRLLRTMVVRLGAAAGEGLVDPEKRIGPYVDALLEVRRHAREGGQWDMADLIRDRLADLGVEVRDEPEGPAWTLRA